MKITLIGNYPPRACGISTFTENLYRALHKNINPQTDDIEVYAMNDPDCEYPYPDVVTHTIAQNEIEAYRQTADRINQSATDVVILQHEYGIFGGEYGLHILELTERLKKPLLVTFHTVLKEPTFLQKHITRSLCRRAESVIVMAQKAVDFLQDTYRVESHKIQLVEHGVPDHKPKDRVALRRKFGFGDRKIITTFGLLGRGKGIETAIRAMQPVVAAHPDAEYWVLGKTHPHVVRHEGEAYRDELTALAESLGIGKNLKYVNKFIEEDELCDYLLATDLYVLPYPNEAQITSGTLAYAIGAGAAVVSTPFWHAQELLADGRGRFFDFNNHENLAEQLMSLLDDHTELQQLIERAAAHGKTLQWKIKGADYLECCTNAQRTFSRSRYRHAFPQLRLPELNTQHLELLIDRTGMIQHAKYQLPLYEEGYCLDDNGRALATLSECYKLTGDQKYLRLLSTCMAYVQYAQTPDGWFRNFMSYDRQFLDDRGTQDAFGRAIWGLGRVVELAPTEAHRLAAEEMFRKAASNFAQLHHPRANAYVILGLTAYLKQHPDEQNYQEMMQRAADQLVERFQHSSSTDWQWFDHDLTYANALLPLALFAAHGCLPTAAWQQTALKATAFLEEITLSKSYYRPVGCDGFYHKDSVITHFDQQPIDAAKMVLMYTTAYQTTQNIEFLRKATVCFNWFNGKNDLDAKVYQPENGGCCDGLTRRGVNANQGAESTLAFWTAYFALLPYQEQLKKSNKQQRNLNYSQSVVPMDRLTGYAKTELNYVFYRKD